MKKLFSKLGMIIAKNRNKKFIDNLYYNIYKFKKSCNNYDFNELTNGENKLLKKLERFNFTTIFDVGANVGDWSNYVHSIFPNSKIHAFELVPNTYNKLTENVNKNPNIILNPFGLSDFNGEIDVFFGDNNKVSTIHKIEGMNEHNDYYKNKIKCEIKKGIEYIESLNINYIDFLKIDTEGNDFKVIKGIGEKIKNIGIIQFEYGVFNIASKDLLIDFYSYLQDFDFVLGKIFPNHIDFSPYHFNLENFDGGNFIAVKKDLKEILNALK